MSNRASQAAGARDLVRCQADLVSAIRFNFPQNSILMHDNIIKGLLSVGDFEFFGPVGRCVSDEYIVSVFSLEIKYKIQLGEFSRNRPQCLKMLLLFLENLIFILLGIKEIYLGGYCLYSCTS